MTRLLANKSPTTLITPISCIARSRQQTQMIEIDFRYLKKKQKQISQLEQICFSVLFCCFNSIIF